MTKKRSKREPTTAERITAARNKTLGIFQPEEPRTIHYVLDHLDRHLDGEGDAQDTAQSMARQEAQREDEPEEADEGDAD